MIPIPCVECGRPAVVSYVNVFDVDRSACSEHSRTVRKASIRDRSIPCVHTQCGRYAVGLLQFPSGRHAGNGKGWAACHVHRPAVRAANPDAEWLPSDRAELVRVIDLTGPVDLPAGWGGPPPGAYDPDAARCWVCGRREGWEHDTAESRVADTESHPFQTGPGGIGELSPELRALCRVGYLEGVQTGRVRRGLGLLTPTELAATYTPFDPAPDPGQPSPRELGEIARQYPELPVEFHAEYAMRARAAAERRVEREGKRA
jgi:DNA-directed RNA polymerase subunit N (RpoN/RPB10)